MDFSYLTVLPRGRQIWDFVVFPPEEFSSRKAKLTALLDEIDVDGLIVYSDGLSRRYVSYLTNYCNSVSWSVSTCLIMRDRDPIIISSCAPRDVTYNKKSLPPSLELNAVGLSLLSNHHVGGKTIAYMKENGLLEKKWAGVNIKSLSKAGVKPIDEAFPDLPDATEAYDRVLSYKSEREIFAVTQASAMAKKAALDYLRMAVPGTNEREIAATVDRALRVYGVDNIALLVSAGKGPVMLHQPEDYVICEGDTVSVHIDIMYLHYNGMFAATMYQGAPDSGRAEFYALVKTRWDEALSRIADQKSLKGINYFDENSYMLVQGIGADTTEAPLPDDESYHIGSGTVLTLTFCSDNNEYGGVIMSDTFAADETGIHPLGGIGANAVATR